jgi:branched-subunit amino acid transport protein AzlD
VSTFNAVRSIALMALVTFLIRVLPFLLFDRGERPPKVVLYLGRVLPSAVIAMLVVYCLRDMVFTPGLGGAALAGWVPQAVAVGAVVLLHLWKRNSLLSIFGGTLLYMFLVQAVFPY